MRTILDYAKEIVDEIYKHDEHWDYTIVTDPNAIELMEKDLYIPYAIMLSKNGFLVANHHEFGTRKHTYRPLGLPVLTTEKSFVKVHLKPKNPQDRKAIENLLNGKN